MNAEIEVPFKSGKEADAALRALEAEFPERDRSSVRLWVEGSKLLFRAESGDVPALRACVNNFLRLVSVVNAGLEGV